MAPEAVGFFELPPEIRNMVYNYIYTDDGKRDWASKVSISATVQTCRQFYKEALPIMYSLHTFELIVHRDGVKHRNGPDLKSPVTAPSRIQHLRLTILTHPTGVRSEVDLDRNIERVEIHLRTVVLALMRGRHLLSTLQINITNYFRTCIRQPALSILMNGLFELQVKDKISVIFPKTPGLTTTPGARTFLERFHRLVLLRGSANKEMWSKQETLGMCLDMWRHANNYRSIVSRWDDPPGEAFKIETKRKLHQVFAIPMWPFSFSRIDELAPPVGFDHEAELRKAVSAVLKIDEVMDQNIGNVRPSLNDRYWPYEDGVKSYLSMLRKRLFMRPAFQEMIGPLDHSPDYSLETLQD